jgi:ribosomal protein L37AE/L43A
MSSVGRFFRLNGPVEKPLHPCPNCGAYLIAPTWSEWANDRCIRNVWSCNACGHEFETSAYLPALPGQKRA